MRSKNHHLLERKGNWHFKVRIPADLKASYPDHRSGFVETTLRTTEVEQARKLRDQHLRRLERLWTEMRLRQGRDVVGAVEASEPLTPDQVEAMIDLHANRIDELAIKRGVGPSNEDLDEARDAVTESGEGERLWREIQILKGSLTPLRPLCDAWLATKGQRDPKTLSDYRLALRHLPDLHDG